MSDSEEGSGTSDASNKDLNYSERAQEILGFSRWWLIVAAAVMMGLVSPYQYVWSSIEGPLSKSIGITGAPLGLVFTFFVVFQAGSQFPVGWWRDRHGPRLVTLVAGLLAGGGYVGLAYADEVWQIYLLYSLGAIGVGIVYTVAVNTALKWFPDRRGLTTGIGTMAFAAGAALFVPYVREYATVSGYPTVLTNMGILIGAGIIISAYFLRDPPSNWASKTDQSSSGDEKRKDEDPRKETDGGGSRIYTSKEVLRTWQFWLMYLMFIGVSGAGLMLTAKIVSFSEGVGLDYSTGTLAAIVLPIAGGVGRLVVGDLSDRINRENAMAVSFTLCGLGVFLVVWFAELSSTIGFLSAVVLATFFWSPQYTLFPSVVGDYYGEKHSSANYALLYSGKMWGGVFGGAITGFLVTATNWKTTFIIGGSLAVLAGIGALLLSPPEN